MPRSQENSQCSSSVENINPDINLDFEENSPFQEGVISEMFQRPDKSFFQDPKGLSDLIKRYSNSNVFTKTGRYRQNKVIQRKVLKGTHLLVEKKGNSSWIFK